MKALEGEIENGKEKVELSVERGSEVKPVLRMDKRQRGTSVVGNPDLLGIPGVGPRNSRKLVEKGFSGVTELKQLYKDKVYIYSPFGLSLLCSIEVSTSFEWCCV